MGLTRWLSGLAAAALLLPLLSCSSPRTEIILVVTSDLAVPGALDGVRFDMTSPSGASQTSGADLATTGLPVVLGMTHEGGALGPFHVVVTGTLGGTDVVARELGLTFVEERTLVYRVVLLSDCVGVDCATDLTCAESGCRPVEIDPGELSDYISGGGSDPICSAEVCNGLDDDCDDTPDEDFDLGVDPMHCGGCNRLCDPRHAIGGCSAGACRLEECDEGWSDCDGDAANGCESDTTDLTNCGACGVPCDLAHAVETCSTGACAIVSCEPGWDNCDGRAENGCETPVDTLADCGACGALCDFAHATESCAAGGCELGSCEPGWGDCDGDPGNGCEVSLSTPAACGGCGTTCTAPTPLCSEGSCVATCDVTLMNCAGSCVDVMADPLHCGACGMACPAATRATPTCSAGVCATTCEPGFFDCDGDPGNGCESDLTDLANCGACGTACDPSRATGSCAGGTCMVLTCDSGYGDCNGSATDGCEASLSTDTRCGSCTTSCSLSHADESCSGGTCRITSCSSGWEDCNGSAPDGCEVPTDTVTNCGGCGVTCGPTEVCSSRSCTAACSGTTCSGSCVDTNTDISHCGGCGMSCPSRPRSSETCSGGSCGFSCDSGWNDCDGSSFNGCESDLTDDANCGACGASCDLSHAVSDCVSRSCALVSCDTGWGNCDGSSANGCETNLSTSTSHCGMCGNACSGGCTAGVCTGGAVIDVSAGEGHTCAVLGTGEVRCWGDNNYGQLGDGNTLTTSPIAVSVMGLTDATSVSVGRQHTCAVRSTGQVVCWGRGSSGRLGYGDTGSRSTPVTVSSISDAVQVSAGGEHTCVRRSGGNVSCFGRGSDGQLGNAETDSFDTPRSVSGLMDAIDVAAGRYSSCAVRSGGGVVCWGRNTEGQLGDGTTSRRTSPAAVAGITDATDVDAGEAFGCAVRSGGGVMCWGRGTEGQMGNGATPAIQSTPVAVSGLSNARSIDAGQRHACVHRTGDVASCWGWNNESQIAATGGDTLSTPVAVSGLSGVSQVAGGGSHSCARLGTSSLRCWGYNFYGQIGDGTTTGRTSPTVVLGVP